MKQIRKLKNQRGFTFVEVVISLIVVNIGLVGLLTGAAYAHSIIRSTEVKNRAFEELRIYTEHLIGLVAHDNLSTVERAGDPLGVDVLLVEAFADNQDIYGTIKREAIKLVPVPPAGDSDVEQFQIHTWIEWRDHAVIGSEIDKSLEFNVIATAFRL